MTKNLGLVRRALYRFYLFAQHIIVPGLRNSQYAYRDTLRSYVRQSSRWLDLGCGHQLLPDWMPESDIEQVAILGSVELAVGVDADLPSLVKHKVLLNRIAGDIERLPFRGRSFDLITANMVLEHVQNPAELLREVQRTLARDGVFLFHTPNRLSYATLIASAIPNDFKVKLVGLLQARHKEDVFPTFYRINGPEAIRVLATQSGFEILELRLVESSAQTPMLGPLVVLELLWIRMLRLPVFRNFRTNIIAALKKAG